MMVEKLRGFCLFLLFCFIVEFCGANPIAEMGKRDGLDQETKKNNLKPNGFHFLLSGKRSSMPRPNSFLFPVKRDAQSFNIPRPNGFMFPQALGKRASGQSSNEEFFNTPRPTSFFWPSMQGKRGPEDHRAATWMQNMARPTGFMFSMAKGKKSEDLDADDFFEDTAAASFIDDSDIFEDDDVADVLEPRQQRSLAEPKDVATFFAGRGKKNHDDQLHSGAKALNSFMNGRGKKGSNNELDMFVAGRGK